jgi:RPM1-interacting protein 4
MFRSWTRMQKRPTVPKFGAWGNDNAGYTVYFEKARENKGATAPPLQRPYNPEEGQLRVVPPPSARPSTAGGRPNGHEQTHAHRRSGSSSSEPGGRGAEQSKFAPPPQYQPRPSHQHHGRGGHRHHSSPAEHGGGGHRQHYSPAEHGGGGHRGTHQAPRHQHHHAAPAPRARSASPQNNEPVSLCFTGQLGLHVTRVHRCSRHGNADTTDGPCIGILVAAFCQNNRQRPAVPKFGVWDEQSAASAAQGFTVMFERVKRDREVARAGGPQVPSPPPPPPEPRHCHRDSPFFAKVSTWRPCFALPSLPRALFTIRTNVLFVVVVFSLQILSSNLLLFFCVRRCLGASALPTESENDVPQ